MEMMHHRNWHAAVSGDNIMRWASAPEHTKLLSCQVYRKIYPTEKLPLWKCGIYQLIWFFYSVWFSHDLLHKGLRAIVMESDDWWQLLLLSQSLGMASVGNNYRVLWKKATCVFACPIATLAVLLHVWAYRALCCNILCSLKEDSNSSPSRAPDYV